MPTSFRHYVMVLRRWLWLFIVATVLTGAISYFVSQRQPVYYTAHARLSVGVATSSPSVEMDDIRTAAQLLETYGEIPTTRPFLEEVLNDLQPIDLDLNQLENQLEVSLNSSTAILTLQFRDRDPDRAVTVVNAIANRLVNQSPAQLAETDTAEEIRTQIARIEQMIAESQTTIDLLETNLKFTTTLDERTVISDQISNERSQLLEEESLLLSLLTALQDTPNNQILLIDPATQGSAIDREIPLKTLFGVIAGLIFAAVIMFAFEYFDDTIRILDDIRLSADVPVLVNLNTHKQPNGSAGKRLIVNKQPVSPLVETYWRLSTKLRFLDSSQNLRSVLIVGLQDTEDTGEIAANLAAAFAQLGTSVVLVDADRRHPVASQIFGLSGQTPLSDLHQGNLSEAIASIADIPGLRLLPAIQKTGASAGTLSSPVVQNLIERLPHMADMVVFITPSLSMYADGLTLAPYVDAVVLVAVSGVSKRHQIQEAIDDLQGVGGHVKGLLLAKPVFKRTGIFSGRKMKTTGKAPRKALSISSDNHGVFQEGGR